MKNLYLLKRRYTFLLKVSKYYAYRKNICVPAGGEEKEEGVTSSFFIKKVFKKGI